MGIYNRDYMYNRGSFGGFRGGMPEACKRLITVTVVVFVMQLLWTRPSSQEDFAQLFPPDVEIDEFELDEMSRYGAYLPRTSFVEEWLELDPDDVSHGQLWRLATCAFCHSRIDLWHILMNMLLLWWFGRTLEMMFGSREFLYFYLTAAIVASLCFVGLAYAFDDPTSAIGASGAVMAVMMVYACYYPRQIIYVCFVIPVEMRFLVLFFVIYDLHPILLQIGGDRMIDGVAHSAHLGGLGFGYLYYQNRWNLERIYSQFRMPDLTQLFSRQTKLRAYEPPSEDDFDERVDAILEKVASEGEESLTDVERQTMIDASRKYRNR